MTKYILSIALVMGLPSIGFTQWLPITSQNYNGTCNNRTDVILNANIDPALYRFGILNRGLWGGGGLDDQYINIGPGDLQGPPNQVNPVQNTMYGVTTTMNSDRMFVGLRYLGAPPACLDNYAGNNSTDAVVAWGNDGGTINPDGSMGQPGDRLIFEFHHFATGPGPSLEVATMLPNGNVGIGTPLPTHQLHVRRGVRFEGLPFVPFNPSAHRAIVQDNTGVLYQTNLTGGGGIINNCAVDNMVPKSDALGNLNCSQIFDNGVSVGIGTTTGSLFGSFNYSLGSGYGTLLGTINPAPATGTLKLDVNGVVRGQAFLAYSDSKLKTNVKDVQHSLEIIQALEGKTYDWNQKAKDEFNADNGRHIGFLAQDVEKIVPEIVTKDNTNTLAINYTELIPILTEGIKEQQRQIEELRKEVMLLKAKKDQPETEDYGNNQGAFKIFPNPSNTHVTFEIASQEGLCNESLLVITDLSGKIVKELKLSPTDDRLIKLEQGTLIPGLYIASLLNNNKPIQSLSFAITQ